MRFAVFLLAMALPTAAFADKPAPRPIDALFGQLRQASTPEDAKPIETQILTLFQESGSPSVDLLMTREAAAETAGDKATAKKLADAITDIAPDFAEGWHRSALLRSASGDDAGAMVCLQMAVKLNPRQFEAMEELGEMLEDYGDKAGALKMYRAAQALDPQLEGLQHHIDGLSRAVEGQGI